MPGVMVKPVRVGNEHGRRVQSYCIEYLIQNIF